MSTQGLVKKISEVEGANSEELFQRRKELLKRRVEEKKLEIVLWESTRKCNLKCIHCGTPDGVTAGDDELQTNEVLDAFGRITKEVDCTSLKYVSITGGEPTVRSDLLEIVKGIRNLGFTNIVMHSNGHKIAEVAGYLEELVEAGLNGIGINLDGLEEKHNWIRNHANSFQLCLKAYDTINNRAGRVNTLISTVIMKENLGDLAGLRNIVFRLQPQRWRLIPLEAIGRAQDNLTNSALTCADLEHLVEFAIETNWEAEKNSTETVTELGCGQWYGKHLEGFVRPYIWHCIAGINTLGILYDGAIGACNNIDRYFVQGNVRTDSIKEVWENRFEKYRRFEWKRHGECLNCGDWDLCHGGEMHRRDSNGNLMGECFYRWLEKKTQKMPMLSADAASREKATKKN